MKHEPDKVDAGPRGGPGGASSDSLPAGFDEVRAGPHGGPGGLAPLDEPAAQPGEEETS